MSEVHVNLMDIPVLLRHQLAMKLRENLMPGVGPNNIEVLGDVFWRFLLESCDAVRKTYEITDKSDNGTGETFSVPYANHDVVHGLYGDSSQFSMSIRVDLTLPANPLFDSCKEVIAYRRANGLPDLDDYCVDADENV